MPFARLLLASFSGMIQILLFPRFSFSPLAWVMLLPLLWVLDRSRPCKSFWLSVHFGLVSAVGVTYWLYHALVGYFGLSPWLALPLILGIHLFSAALYFGFFGLLAGSFRDRFHSWYAPFWIAALWVLSEFARGRSITKDPWMLLGYSQHANLGIIQIADLTGVYGVSFLIVMINVCLYQILSHVIGLRRNSVPFRAGFVLGRSGVAVAVVLLCWLYGHIRLQDFDRTSACPGGSRERPVRIAVVQGNIPSEFRWKSIFYAKTLEIYLRASLKVLEEPGLDLLVWPENALNFHPDREGLFLKLITSSLKSGSSTLVTGAPRMEEGNGRGKQLFFNSVFFITGSGIQQIYDKIVLLPLSEKKDLWPLRLFRSYGESPAEFTPGTDYEVFRSPFGDFSTPVCFEMIYPEHVRKFVEKGAGFLVNLSNDSWLGPTAAPHQHLVYSVFRAIENRRWVVRAANTGISAFVAPSGRIVSRSDLNEAAVLQAEVEPLRIESLYTRRGDWFVGLCLAVVVCGCLGSVVARKLGKRV